MATKVKPSRINISWTPQAWDVPVYVDEDCFCWWQNWAWDVTWPASSTDWNVAVFDWGTWKAIKDSWKSINCLAQLCDIPTDNCELANWCWYTTCTWTLVPADIQNLAQCCDIPTDNCQLANGCWYTTCTGTLVPSDLYCYAQCCDIPTDNCQLSNGCNYLKSCDLPDLSWYQLKCNMVCDLTWADNNHYPTAKAVVDAMGCLWGWDMLKATYDPCNCSDDAFDYNNFYNTPNMCCYAQICDVPTDNCQLANWCCYADCDYVNNSINSVTAYYITKNAQWDQFATYAELAAATTFYSGWQVRTPTRNDYTIVLADENYSNATTRYIYNSGWEYQYTVNETALTQQQLDALNSGITCSKVDCYDNCLAQCCDIPTNNCQLTNWCWYITGINCSDVTTALWYTPAQCCDIPTDNCQLWNSCGYIKWITCSDVTTALWYTPYSNTNPNWYTSCTWTLKACDLCWYAQCCDIPTDNCELGNGCGYTTCTGTLNWWDLKTVNGNCLVGSWDICIQAWVTSVNWCTWAVCLTIPTDNCQLANGCWYTTCTGTVTATDLQCYVQECCVATINGCCLTQWGNICISWWGWVSFKSADILIVWWGGAGGSKSWCHWWWGGWWEVIEMNNYLLWWSSYSVVIGAWWNWVNQNTWWNWGDSCFGAIIAKWWCGGNCSWIWWTSGSGNCWWEWAWSRAGGWWGGNNWAWWYGTCATGALFGWNGWAWYTTNISWTNCWYWWWGGAGGCNANWRWSAGWWNGWWSAATWCGWWGGWRCGGAWWKGWNWVVIIRYGENGECGINCATWWTVYCCNWYIIHCFTSNWTFCIVS